MDVNAWLHEKSLNIPVTYLNDTHLQWHHTWLFGHFKAILLGWKDLQWCLIHRRSARKVICGFISLSLVEVKGLVEVPCLKKKPPFVECTCGKIFLQRNSAIYM